MTRIKYICTLALALCCATAVLAQNAPQQNTKKQSVAVEKISQAENTPDLDKKLQKEIEKQQLRQAQNTLPRCAACGETITGHGQHCSASGCTGLCSASQPTEQTGIVYTEENTYCPQCGAPLSIDERYHGVPHYCKCEYCEEPILSDWQPCYAQDAGHICTPEQNHSSASEQHPDKHCIYCGRAITTDYQSCEHGGICTTHCPECGKDLRDPKNVSPNGTHHCRGKLHITPVEPKK